jgi:hypothetical protein
VLVAALAISCNRHSGTFVLLKFQGQVAATHPIHSIKVNLQFSGRTDSTTFQAPNGGDIVLPTDATLQIGSGAGELEVTADALASDSSELATGSGSGSVTSGQTSTIVVHFGGESYDGGSDGSTKPDAGADGAPDFPVDVSTDVADARGSNLDVSMSDSATLGAGGAGGLSGTGAGGAIGSGGAGPDARNPDVSGGAVDTGAGGSDGGTAQLSLSSTVLDFGVVAVGSTSIPLNLTVTNVGTAPSSPLVVFVNDGRHFSVLQDHCSGAVLRPGDNCVLAFTFTPDALGSLQTDGSIGPAAGTTAKFSLKGTTPAGNAALSMNPTTVDFNLIDIGNASSMVFTVTNNGGGDLGTLKILVTGPRLSRL